MRSEDEILEKARKVYKNDLFGIVVDYIEYLPYEKAKEFMKPEVTKEKWNQVEYTKEHVIGEIKKYLPFAYDKAEGARGISSNRSIQHFEAWLWLLKDYELLAFVLDWDNYAMYGFPMLQKIAEKYMPELVKPYKNIENNTGAPVL